MTVLSEPLPNIVQCTLHRSYSSVIKIATNVHGARPLHLFCLCPDCRRQRQARLGCFVGEWAVVMLSSRLPNALYADKENSTAVASSRNTQSILKTPGAKPTQIVCARTVKASSSKQKPESRRVEHYKGIGAATIALEPGARVLGAKDGNNRSGFAARGHSQAAKGKGKAFDSVYEDCSLMRE